jgi:peptidoglycan hydrolase-like protein with peptidoglycan-binding domain
MTEPMGEGPRAVRRGRRVRWVVAGVAVLAVLGVGTGVVLTRLSGRPAATAEAPSPVQTAEVSQVDLADRRSVSGKLGYGTEHQLSGRKQGTITALPAQGAVLERGATVYQVDAKPVPLIYSDTPLYREIGSGVTDGLDVKAIEENLKALGYTGFGTPDKKFTDATAAAIKKWQKALGWEQTGILAPGDVVVTSGPIRVSSVTAELGGQAGGAVLKYTGTGKAVTVDLKASQKDMAKIGAKVSLSVEHFNANGTIASVVPASPDSNGQDSEQQFTVTITIDDQKAIGDLDAGTVDIRFTTEVRKGVLAVPVGALLALAEGGYAVEVMEGANRRLVAVQPGLFADGQVEVSGPELKAGMRVVTTA